MVEICPDISYTQALLADEILDWITDIVELNVGCAGGEMSGNLDSTHGPSKVVEEGDEEKREARWTWARGTHCHCCI